MINSILIPKCSLWLITLAVISFSCAPVDSVSISVEVLGEDFDVKDAVAHDSGFNGLLLTLFEREVGCNVEIEPDESVVVLQFVDSAGGTLAFTGVGDYESGDTAKFELVYVERACEQEDALRSTAGEGEILTFDSKQVSGVFEASSDEGEATGDFDVPMCEGNAPALPSSCE